jgi:hypothetical protein
MHRVVYNTLVSITILMSGCSSNSDNDTYKNENTASISDTSSNKEWYQGGTLHSSPISEWKTASYENKLATAGDILSATVWKGYINTQSDMDDVKSEAESLVKEIDTATVDVEITNNMSVASIAAMIIPQRNDFGPN